jgi:hypothetical protein
VFRGMPGRWAHVLGSTERSCSAACSGNKELK